MSSSTGTVRRRPQVTAAVLLASCAAVVGFATREPAVLAAAARVQPAHIVYKGAFRLPGNDTRPLSFAYGGNAMTYNPNGDTAGASDGYPGSLFVSGHDRISFELPNGGQIAEITIPTPVIASSVDALPTAAFVQSFREVTAGLFAGVDEIPRIGLQYLDHHATGPRIHITWGQHIEETHATQALFGPDLATPDTRGAWHIDGASQYSVNDYMLEVPSAWAATHASGRSLATGRFKDGGWSGKGPALWAYVPWSASGTLAAAGAHLSATPLLQYESSETNADVTHASLSGYQHPDEWAGGAWVTTSSGASALLVVGNKSVGTKYWYGWAHPAGKDLPCVETEYVDQFTVCWTAAGVPCGSADLGGCAGHNDFRGWWSTQFTGRILFYDPADLAQVAAGTIASSQPQPYATLDIEPYLFKNPAGTETEMIGTGVQRRYKIGSVAYDRQRNALYVLELFADEAKPVVHVFEVQDASARPQSAWHDWFAVDTLETPYVGDFDGDGRTDIITFTRQNPAAVGDVYVALSNGTRFGANTKWHDWFAISTDETVVIGDYDGDRRDDVATWLGATTRQVYVALSNGTGMAAEKVWLAGIGSDRSDVLLAADANADGRDDLVMFERTKGEVWVALSTGTAFAAPTRWHGFFAVSTYERPRTADVTGDGKADIVTFATDSPTAHGDVYVATAAASRFVDLEGVPDSSSKWHDWFAIRPTEEIRVGDLDGDDRDDFFTFLPMPWGQAYTVRSLGTAMAPNTEWREQVLFAETDRPFVGDVNGDGKADIIVFAQGVGKVYVSLAP